MNIIGKLTLRQLSMNKKRTLVTICGIIISVAMLTAIPTALVSFMSWMAQKEMYAEGNWHLQYKEVTAEQAQILLTDERVEGGYRISRKGFAKPDFTLEKYKPYIYVEEIDESAFRERNVRLLEGRMPENGTELIISEELREAALNGGRKLEIGDTLELSLGERHYFYETGEMSEWFLSNYSAIHQDEILTETKQTSYTIVGIMERDTQETAYSPGFTALSGTGDAGTVSDVYLRVKKVSNRIYETGTDLAVKCGMSKEAGFDNPVPGERFSNRLSYHSTLLRYLGVSDNGSFTQMMVALGVITITVIILGSVALIYNAFAISLSERSRYLGMLASVGATKKQKRYSVFSEGFFLGIISIPIGVLAGLAGIGITFRLIAPMINKSLFAGIAGNGKDGIGISLVVSWEAIGLAVFCAVLTIFISTWIPARKASRITAIEAIRSSKDVKLTRRKVKTSKLVTKLFGFEAELGLKNLKRNKGRYRATVFSLVVSVVVFLSMSVLMEYLKSSYRMAVNETTYDVNSQYNGGDLDEFIEDLSRATQFRERAITISTAETCFIPSEYVKKGEREEITVDGVNKSQFYVTFIGLDDETLSEYAEKTGASFEKLKNTETISGIFMDLVRTERERKYSKINLLSIQENTVVPLQFCSYNSDAGDGKGAWEKTGEPLQITAEAVTDEIPMGGSYPGSAGQFKVYLSMEAFNSLFPEEEYSIWNNCYFYTDDWQALLDELDTIRTNRIERGLDLYTENAKGDAEQIIQTITMIEVFTTGFLVLILAICIANIFNTISTSIALRRREFAMLKSVGMTAKGFRKMIHYESVFYGLKALLYGLPLSFCTIVMMYAVIRDVFTQSFILPWDKVAAAVVMVIGVVGATMMYSSAKVRKGNIVDALKDENL